jgi:non-heme chloroperoxidase
MKCLDLQGDWRRVWRAGTVSHRNHSLKAWWQTMTSHEDSAPATTRRALLAATGATGLALGLPASALAAVLQHPTDNHGAPVMTTIKTRDGTEIFYKDWGPKDAQPIVFHHGWPLTGDDWDNQMLFFLGQGYRVIAHDRRGHGRSAQTDTGNDMDHYAADVADLAAALDLRSAIHVGHSTGGGEVARYVARHGGGGRVAKAVLIGAITPVMVKTAGNPGGLPLELFDGFRASLAANRAQYFWDLPSGPFYGFNRPGATPQPGVIANWWRQGMQGGAKAHYDCIKAFSETDFTEDLRAISVPTLVLHGDDDQLVPVDTSARLAAPMLRKGELKIYPGFSHGMCTVNSDVVNADLLAFFKK